MKLTGRLVVASHNEGKVAEIRALLAPFKLDIVSARELDLPEPDETEQTFAGNAALKAEAACAASGLPALADDSGLCVDALDGAPGIYSARWAGPSKDFNAAMARVHDELRLQNLRDWEAQFVCALALARPGAATEIFEGVTHGGIVWPPRGQNGFGYDPIFAPEGLRRTFGEMSAVEKLPLTHRAKAFAKLAAALE